MIFRPTELSGCYVVEPERQADERGFFARTFDAEEFERRGLNPRVQQCSVSVNISLGTLRGMHYQAAPHEEAKLVRCTRGRIFDAVVDVRHRSPTYLRWVGVELDEHNGLSLYIPEGLAHGFVTLEPECEVSYQISHGFVPAAARGLRWDDPAVGIAWPDVGELNISDRDRAWPLLAAGTETTDQGPERPD